MTIRISHQRSKCVGCFACVILAADRWRISRKDGKSILIGGTEKKGFFIAAIGQHEYVQNKKAEQICPARIIRVNKYKKNVT